MNKETGKLQRKVFNAPPVLLLERSVYRVADQRCFIKLDSLRLNQHFENGNTNIDPFWLQANSLHRKCVEKNTTHFILLPGKSFVFFRNQK